MFKKAERKKVKLKLAITGPSGAGKTFSALRLAKGIGGKVAVIDTENGSASLYSDHFDFDVLDMQPPFTTEKYIEAINNAEKAGYSTIVIDSLTHAWAGEGGLLEQKAALDSRPNSNHWTNWGPIDKKDTALKNAFLHSSCHVIATMRSKMEYAQSEENGKKKIAKVGMAPIQRDGLSYDFTIVFDVAMDHKAETSKDRTGLFVDKVFPITEETGATINKWIESAAEAPLKAEAEKVPSEPKKDASKEKLVKAPKKYDFETYVIGYGQKMSGHKLHEFAIEKHEWTINYLNEQKANGLKWRDNAIEYHEIASAYVANKKEAAEKQAAIAEEPDGPIGFDKEESMPV